MKSLTVIFLLGAVFVLSVSADKSWTSNNYYSRAAAYQQSDKPKPPRSQSESLCQSASISPDGYPKSYVHVCESGIDQHCIISKGSPCCTVEQSSEQPQPVKEVQLPLPGNQGALAVQFYSSAGLQGVCYEVTRPIQSCEGFSGQACVEKKLQNSLETDILAAVEGVLEARLHGQDHVMTSEYNSEDAHSNQATVDNVDFTEPVSPKDYQRIIGPGFATNYFKFQGRPGETYHELNIRKISERGFRNVRLRARPFHYTCENVGDMCDEEDVKSPYDNNEDFDKFLMEMEEVVDDCLAEKVAPIISWEYHRAEAEATDQDKQNYITWWTKLARRLRNKSYHLSFNLFTELGVDYCNTEDISCKDSLKENPGKYNNWTNIVIKAIRGTGGNNAKRILILGAPQKSGDSLDKIDSDIYMKESEKHLMFEYHLYAGGPNKKILKNGRRSQRYWIGYGDEDSDEDSRQKVRNAIGDGVEFGRKHGLYGYFGAWMPQDNSGGELNQEEVVSFAEFFVQELKRQNMPWSLNSLDVYMDTETNTWIEGVQRLPKRMRIPEENRADLNMAEVLEKIIEVM